MQSMYIHIPFCKKICSYCDFCKMYYHEKQVNDYLKALKEEIESMYEGEPLRTLYVGGGTPSSLKKSQLQELFKTMKVLKLQKDYEYTFECNIEDITKEKLIILRENNINRLSIGVQSFHKKYLKYLGRNHEVEEVEEKIRLAKKMGFENISIDLMYAFTEETLEEVKEDLECYLSLNIPHISAYSLILEPNTMLYIKNTEPIDEDLDAEMYHLICQTLSDHGYDHYEVSNFARKGYASKHNLTYWNNEEYYGFGLGASGYIKNRRYENTRSLRKYLDGKYRVDETVLSMKDQIQNEYMLGFRKIRGISKTHFFEKYKQKIEESMQIKKLLEEEKLLQNKEYIYVNPKYIYVMNSLLIDIMEG